MSVPIIITDVLPYNGGLTGFVLLSIIIGTLISIIIYIIYNKFQGSDKLK